MANPVQATVMGNITRVVPVDSSVGLIDENGFFIRVATSGLLKYCPMGNQDSEYIIKQFDASNIFVDPEICRRIFPVVNTSPDSYADDIYVGYGV